jgi:hypothetical protein
MADLKQRIDDLRRALQNLPDDDPEATSRLEKTASAPDGRQVHFASCSDFAFTCANFACSDWILYCPQFTRSTPALA